MGLKLNIQTIRTTMDRLCTKGIIKNHFIVKTPSTNNRYKKTLFFTLDIPMHKVMEYLFGDISMALFGDLRIAQFAYFDMESKIRLDKK